MKQTAVVFNCDEQQLVGVVSAPDRPAETAVVIIVGGPQYRVGSHRQFVQLAEALAGAGVAALRFDVRGMGDSDGAQRGYEEIDQDIGAAIDEIQRVLPAVRHVVLWGLCGGASAALLYLRATRDVRVSGLVLVNPWVRTALTQARTRVKHYYAQRLLQREFWVKLLRGGVAARALGEFLSSARASLRRDAEVLPVGADRSLPVQFRLVDTWSRFAGPTLLVLSENDYTAKEFLEATAQDDRWLDALRSPRVTRVDVAGADHTFSDSLCRERLEATTVRWLHEALGLRAGLAESA